MKIRCGDVIINNHASDCNLHKRGVVIEKGKGWIKLTDLRGGIWCVLDDAESDFATCGIRLRI